MVADPIITELRLPSRLGFEKVAMDTAASVAALMRFTDDRVQDLKTAVSEACINAIEHANKLSESLSVVVTLAMSVDSLEVEIRDHGEGVQHEMQVPDIDRKMMGEDEARGMGMFLIQALVDKVEYGREPAGAFARLVIHLRTEGEQA